MHMWGLKECPRRSTGLVGIASSEPLAVTRLLVLPCPSRWRIELWRRRARLRWGRRGWTRGVTLCLSTKSPLEWLKGLGHHVLEPLQKGFPLWYRAFRAIVDKVYPFLGLTLACCICKLACLNHRCLKIKIMSMQTKKLYHFSRQQPVFKTTFQICIPLFGVAGGQASIYKVRRACSKSGIVSLSSWRRESKRRMASRAPSREPKRRARASQMRL